MGSALGDLARIEHDDFIGIDNGRQAVGDHQRGAVARDLAQRRLDFLFGEAVKRRGRLVENQNGRAFQNGAGNRDALLLAAGQFQAALAHHGVITLGQAQNEVVDLRHLGGGFDFGVARIGPAIADVVADGVVEQHRILRHHADGGAQGSFA